MLIPLSDMTRYTTPIDEEKVNVVDIFFSASDWRLKHLMLDMSGWFDQQGALVSADHVRDINTDDRQMDLSVTKADLDVAPRLSSWNDGVNLFGMLPPIVIGPFGNTVSPQLAAAGMVVHSKSQVADPEPAIQFARFSKWSKLEVFGTEGQLGTLEDLLYDPEKQAISHMVVDNGKRLPGRQLVLPIEVFRHIADQETHIVVALNEEQLSKAPQIETLDQVDRHWIDTVRTYFALPV
ncbi:PRC-barrel domain-containing protein [Arenibacterium sp. CAU 1754]